MTRKDFKEIADSVRREVATDDERKALADALCTYFKSVNTRFDRDRFIAACGL
ncbi:hypothetical protein G3I59_32280 [Amycolatopsis rubida]|uniref:Uncharacterized protein n=1 Tax=Amycolatopsis rubida TaxID=112413 RepID=A0ABX0C1T3_9PSEU|nr:MULTISPECIES: hypothetical protein [Amycolatopsis]MYW90482.1 hypothetical protein [Amycolatopsis rubida]MYW95150.1 hypothetical protein [Amycolatopsis rubida]NEC55461.1 hypothetical protein [Amycolatopsis rubida]NEC60138.1 hypothetical protein [Amycolatopsis rubida]OAP25024.1 hypothetical protein A4R44_04093 [Amycolatopsis sp. M39]